MKNIRNSYRLFISNLREHIKNVKGRVEHTVGAIAEKARRLIDYYSHPHVVAADIVYRFYKRDRNRIPYPFLRWLISVYGGWAGVTITLARREYQFEVKVKKATSIILTKIVPLLILVVILISSLFIKQDNFYFGFLQNLLSEFVFILLLLYILPKVTNPKKNFNVDFYYVYVTEKDNKSKFKLVIRNSGEEVFKPNELMWEIYFPKNYIELKEIKQKGNKISSQWDYFHNSWCLQGYNKKPLFLDQQFEIASFSIDNDLLYGTNPSNDYGELKLYYRISTIYGNIPNFEDATEDFVGYGISVENYPQVSGLDFSEYYKYEKISQQKIEDDL